MRKAGLSLNSKSNTYKLTISALLIAVGILIPLISPLKIIVEPASFTLASHVATMIAMFLSPGIAASVAVGTAFGFLLGGFPIVIVLRAASHMIFAFVGSKRLAAHPDILQKKKFFWLFNLLLGVLHAFCEVVVVSLFYFSGNLPADYYNQGMVTSVMLLVGVGTVIHSMIDFWIAKAVWSTISKQSRMNSLGYSK